MVVSEREPNAQTVSALDDATLLRQVAGGDSDEPLAELYRRYAHRVYEYGLHRLGDPGMADELVQETFLYLWRTAGHYDHSRGRAIAFLLTIAHSRAVDLLRRPSSRPVPTEPALLEDITEQPDTADAVQTRVVLRQALAALSVPHREVLLLSYHRDLSQAEIAGVLGIPLGTVKTRSHYALRALKLALAERGIHG